MVCKSDVGTARNPKKKTKTLLTVKRKCAIIKAQQGDNSDAPLESKKKPLHFLRKWKSS